MQLCFMCTCNQYNLIHQSRVLMHLVHVHVGQSGILADNVHFRFVHILTFIIIVVLVLIQPMFCIPIEQCFICLNDLY